MDSSCGSILDDIVIDESILDELENDVMNELIGDNILVECDSEIALAESVLHQTTNACIGNDSFCLSLDASNNLFQHLLTSQSKIKISQVAKGNCVESLGDNIPHGFNYLMNIFNDQNHDQLNVDEPNYEKFEKAIDFGNINRCDKNDTIVQFNNDKILQQTTDTNIEATEPKIYDDILNIEKNDNTIIVNNTFEDINDITLTNDEPFGGETKNLFSPNTTIVFVDKDKNSLDVKIKNKPLLAVSFCATINNNKYSPLKLYSPNTNIAYPNEIDNGATKYDISPFELSKTLTINNNNSNHCNAEPNNQNTHLGVNTTIVAGDKENINKNLSKLNVALTFENVDHFKDSNKLNFIKPYETITSDKNDDTQMKSTIKPNTIVSGKNEINCCEFPNVIELQTIPIESQTIKTENATEIKKRYSPIIFNKAITNDEKLLTSQESNKRDISEVDCLEQPNKKRKVLLGPSTMTIELKNPLTETEIKESDVSHFEINYTRAIFDADETADYNDPKWSILKELKTTEDYFNSVRTQWRSQILPNPHEDLTKRYVSIAANKPTPKNPTEQYHAISCTQYLSRRISTLNDKSQSLYSQLNKLRNSNRRRYDRQEISKLTNEIDKLKVEIRGIEKNREEIKQINKYYTEANWNANYLTNNQMKEVEEQDTLFEFQKMFYQ